MIMVDTVKLSTKSLLSWFDMYSVNSLPLDVFSECCFKLFHKNLELALEMLLQKVKSGYLQVNFQHLSVFAS